jgi:phospholipase C
MAIRMLTQRSRSLRSIALAALLLLGADSASTAAAVTPRPAVPTAFITPIQHVVVIYQENHSFDNVLGNWCNTFSPARCNGFTGTVKLQNGSLVAMKQSPDVVPQVDHGVQPQVAAIDGGKMDGWALIHGCAASFSYACLTYYTASQIPNLAALAAKFAVSDRTFSMADSPSFGGHLYAVGATTDNFNGNNPLPSKVPPGPGWGCDSKKDAQWIDPVTGKLSQQPACIPDPSLPGVTNGGAYRPTTAKYVPTIMDRLDASGLTWRIYAATSVQSKSYNWSVCPSYAECLYGPQHKNMVSSEIVLADAAKGTLPNFSLVTPGGGVSANASQHNGASMLAGDNWIGQVVSAIEKGPNWKTTAIFIAYDDCGCFYDHVPPGTNPDRTQQGPRVPLVIVSPYARPAYTDSTPATFASILAYEEHVFGLSPLTSIDAAAYNFANSFNYSQIPLAAPAMVNTPLPPGEIIQAQTSDVT